MEEDTTKNSHKIGFGDMEGMSTKELGRFSDQNLPDSAERVLLKDEDIELIYENEKNGEEQLNSIGQSTGKFAPNSTPGSPNLMHDHPKLVYQQN